MMTMVLLCCLLEVGLQVCSGSDVTAGADEGIVVGATYPPSVVSLSPQKGIVAGGIVYCGSWQCCYGLF